MSRLRGARSIGLATWFAGGVCVSVLLLTWFGLRASREFERSSRLIVQRRAEEASRLLVTALTRDMRAAQENALSSSTWDEFRFGTPQEVVPLVASAFARYPYPDAFFAWQATAKDQVVFYTRSDRPPTWAPIADGPNHYPVRITESVAGAEVLLPIIRADARIGRPYAIGNAKIGQTTYQVVTHIKYADRFRQEIASARGFLVDLGWVRANYFGSLTEQVAQINGESPGLEFNVVDEDGVAVVGRPGSPGDAPVSERSFLISFFDPALIAVNRPANFAPVSWTVRVSGASDPTLGVVLYRADLALLLAAIAGVVLAFSLGAMARTMRAAANLAEMRAEFMSSVTHDLKTPIASIRAMGELLTGGRINDAKRQQEYGAVVAQEATRLARLVDNVLAHARITDVLDVYSFESVDLEEMVGEALSAFRVKLRQEQFLVRVELGPDLPPIVADRAALTLLLDNLIDNAIRHSGTAREIRIAAEIREKMVCIEVTDYGVGIPPEDLIRIKQKFVRGRNAAPGGSGLGLAIVSRIVADHRGRFEIESVLGSGATMRVYLPLAPGARNPAKSVDDRGSISATVSGSAGNEGQ